MIPVQSSQGIMPGWIQALRHAGAPRGDLSETSPLLQGLGAQLAYNSSLSPEEFYRLGPLGRQPRYAEPR